MNQVGSKINILLTTSQKSGGQESVKKKAEKKQFSTYKGNASRNRIIDIIEHNPFVTSMEIAEDLGINRSAVQKHLQKLLLITLQIQTHQKIRPYGQYNLIRYF